jgi:hypothetical protein
VATGPIIDWRSHYGRRLGVGPRRKIGGQCRDNADSEKRERAKHTLMENLSVLKNGKWKIPSATIFPPKL